MATLSFWGGVGTVTGSKYLLETDRRRVLVDCGLFQGLKELRERNWQPLPFDLRHLDAVVLTHAHIDHTGYLPRLFAQGYRGPVYCSRATAALLEILLPDSARLQEEDADYRNRHHLTQHKPALPLYTEQDARVALSHLRPVAGGDQAVSITEGIQAQFFPVGHILGARFVLVTLDGEEGAGEPCRVLFSGDLGRYDQPLLQDPMPPIPCDYLLIESTYGDRLHSAELPKEALARIINAAVKRDGPILIPAFALDRMQTVICLLRELEEEGRIPVLPVCLDSPMAAAATRLYAQLLDEDERGSPTQGRKRSLLLHTHHMNTTAARTESKRLNELQGSRIILSASGMMTGGRVLHHAQRILPDKNATLVFVGYQAEGTTGRRILNGEESVKIFKQWVPVRCHVEQIDGFSAHPDWKEILLWLERLATAPRGVFITHGEPPAAQAMREHLIQRFGWDVTVPQYGDRITLRS